MHVARNNFSPVNVARTSKKVGQPCTKVSHVATAAVYSRSILSNFLLFKGSIFYYFLSNIIIGSTAKVSQVATAARGAETRGGYIPQ